MYNYSIECYDLLQNLVFACEANTGFTLIFYFCLPYGISKKRAHLYFHHHPH